LEGQVHRRREPAPQGVHPPSRPLRARAYIAGLGYYELRLNGRKIGDQVLDPGWTTYDKRVLYAAYDVTDALEAGANAVGILLGQGWYGAAPPCFNSP